MQERWQVENEWEGDLAPARLACTLLLLIFSLRNPRAIDEMMELPAQVLCYVKKEECKNGACRPPQGLRRNFLDPAWAALLLGSSFTSSNHRQFASSFNNFYVIQSLRCLSIISMLRLSVTSTSFSCSAAVHDAVHSQATIC